MEPDRLQLQRWELKYFLNEEKALALRDFVRQYLDLDEHGVDRPNYAYPIHSLYLDSDDLRTYWETVNGNKNRYKLRLRYYDELPSSPVFFEIKRRSNDAIVKKRGGVKREAVNWLLAGHLPEPEHLLWDATAQLYAVEKFSYLMLDIKATPKVHVAYMREAWVSTKDNSIRVTMDRQVRTAPEFTNCLSTEVCDPVKPFGDRIVLELKFTGRFPNWFREMVQAFDLNRSSAAKYADGVAIMGEDRLYRNRVNGHRFPGAHIEAGASRLGRGSREAGAFV